MKKFNVAISIINFTWRGGCKPHIKNLSLQGNLAQDKGDSFILLAYSKNQYLHKLS
jgi:hypothetical protein